MQSILKSLPYTGPLLDRKTAQANGISRYFTGSQCKYGHISQRYTKDARCVACNAGKNIKLNALRPTKGVLSKRPRNVARKEAKAAGEIHYFDGRPCKYGHIAKHLVSNGNCVVCANDSSRRNYSKYKPRRQAYGRVYRKAYIARRLKKKEIIAGREKPKLCEICNKRGGKIVFDHDHSTGKFRGWICDHCNLALGNVFDDINILKKLISYLECNDSNKPVSSELTMRVVFGGY